MTTVHINVCSFASKDHIAIQDFGAGAMENWGLITYQDIYLLYGLEELSDNTFYSKLVTHELAHMVGHEKKVLLYMHFVP